MKRIIGIIMTAISVISCTSCTQQPSESEQASSPVKSGSVSIIQNAASISQNAADRRRGQGSVPGPDAAVLIRGKELLKEYDVTYSQTIHFPHEGYFYKSHGDLPLTSPEEAREKYPDWPIPDKLGDYLFSDLTVYRDRTDSISPNNFSPPRETIEVRDDEEPVQYYVCYQKDGSRFRLNMLPMFLDLTWGNLISSFTDPVPWEMHPEAFYEYSDEEKPLFDRLLIPPEDGGGYAFFVQKVEGPDCLESETVPFSEEEASSIYDAIREGFKEKTAL